MKWKTCKKLFINFQRLYALTFNNLNLRDMK